MLNCLCSLEASEGWICHRARQFWRSSEQQQLLTGTVQLSVEMGIWMQEFNPKTSYIGSVCVDIEMCVCFVAFVPKTRTWANSSQAAWE